jgi:hypothetical protein
LQQQQKEPAQNTKKPKSRFSKLIQASKDKADFEKGVKNFNQVINTEIATQNPLMDSCLEDAFALDLPEVAPVEPNLGSSSE